MLSQQAVAAIFQAVEMEGRAVRMYERALVLFGDKPCADALRAMLRDERTHLATFSRMLEGNMPDEHAELLASAQAASVLHAGGLMQAQREGAFDSERALLAYAAKEERAAVDIYTKSAEACPPDAKDAFLRIAREEQSHLDALLSKL